MSISKEYKNQNKWRNWESYLKKIPFNSTDTVLDLGCSLGFVSKLISNRVKKVYGVDINEDFINKAKEVNSSKNIKYYNSDLKDLSALNLPKADIIWTSFVAAYFPDFHPTLYHWRSLLKPNGIIAITEIDDLFGHYPLNRSYQKLINEYYNRQREHQVYDFEMGSKLKDFLINNGFRIELEEEIPDKELTFNGTADSLIFEAWENRLNRMLALQEYLGKGQFIKFKKEFIDCFSNKDHISKTKVNFLIARKQ